VKNEPWWILGAMEFNLTYAVNFNHNETIVNSTAFFNLDYAPRIGVN
jgi:hypothetical protein